MKNYRTFVNEQITLDVKPGDVILGGKFRNKKITVKTIEVSHDGFLVINGNRMTKFRIIPQTEEQPMDA